MICKICGGGGRTLFNATILKKYPANYNICANCGFLSVENPTWLPEAYKNTINIEDTGILQRNIWLSEKAATIIALFFEKKSKFLDFAGGYGLFTRLMRDKGFDFYWHDPYTSNFFARGFEFNPAEKVELLTTFESFEHFLDPVHEMDAMLDVSRNILFTTTLLPDQVPPPGKWWYYGLEHGQHISFYTERSLHALSNKYHLNFYTNGHDLHLFTDKMVNPLLFWASTKLRGRFVQRLACRGLNPRTMADMEYVSRAR